MTNLKRRRCNTSDFGLVQETAQFLTTQNFTTVSRLAPTSKNAMDFSKKYLKCGFSVNFSKFYLEMLYYEIFFQIKVGMSLVTINWYWNIQIPILMSRENIAAIKKASKSSTSSLREKYWYSFITNSNYSRYHAWALGGGGLLGCLPPKAKKLTLQVYRPRNQNQNL